MASPRASAAPASGYGGSRPARSAPMPRRCSWAWLLSWGITCGERAPMTFPILSSLIALPIVGAFLLLLVPDEARHEGLVHKVALIVSVLVFAETVLLWARFNPTTADFQFVERHAWIPSFGISYAVGVDGINLLLLVLTGF